MIIPLPYYKIIAVFLIAMMVAVACATGTAPEATVARAQQAQPSVSEINRTLATLAGSTATSGDYRIGPEDLLQITLYNVTADSALTPASDARMTPRTLTMGV